MRDDDIRKKYAVTDTLSGLIHSDQLDEREGRLILQQFSASLEAFKPLRQMTQARAGKEIIMYVDRAVQQHVDNPKTNGHLVTCRKGCGHCCKMPVIATLPEAVIALDFAEAAGVHVDEEKLARQSRYSDDAWFEQPAVDIACVFLSEQNECRIYPARPASCRKHFSLGDPSDCDIEKRGKGFFMKRWVSPLAEILYSAVMNVLRAGSWPKVLLIIHRRRTKGGTS